jgi:hypothetical protein
MGQLNKSYFDAYSASTDVFVETGTYQGDTVAVAADFGFRSIYSIELNQQLSKRCQQRFKNDNSIQILCGDSPDVLQQILQGIDSRCTFWLDAHRSFSLKTPGSNIYGPSPLLQELKAIARSSRHDHVIFIDDCRLFDTESWNYLSKQSVVDQLLKINPDYKIEYLDGGTSFGMINPKDDIMVAYL